MRWEQLDTRRDVSNEQLELRLPDRPESPARARELLRDLRGSPADRIDDARLLLHELVAAALFEGVGSVRVHVGTTEERLRFEVIRNERSGHGARLGHHLIEGLSSRCGGDGTMMWCELDGAWSLRGAAPAIKYVSSDEGKAA